MYRGFSLVVSYLVRDNASATSFYTVIFTWDDYVFNSIRKSFDLSVEASRGSFGKSSSNCFRIYLKCLGISWLSVVLDCVSRLFA